MKQCSLKLSESDAMLKLTTRLDPIATTSAAMMEAVEDMNMQMSIKISLSRNEIFTFPAVINIAGIFLN